MPKPDSNNTEMIDIDSFFFLIGTDWKPEELQDSADYELYFREQFNVELILQQYQDILNEMLNLVVSKVYSKQKNIRWRW